MILRTIPPVLVVLALFMSGCGGGGGSGPSAAEPQSSDNPTSPQGVTDSDDPANNNEYIVVFDNDRVSPSEVDALAEQLARSVSGQVEAVFNDSMRGFVISGINQERADALAARAEVEYVEEDGNVKTFDIQFGAPWGLDRVDQFSLPLNGSYDAANNASNVHLYLLDTGIRSKHNEFVGRVGTGFDATVRNGLFGTGLGAGIVGGDIDNVEDCNGHGTHVAGIAAGSTYGIAKRANIHAVRVTDCNGNGTVSDVIAGIEWVARNAIKPAVVNISVGGSASPAMDRAIRGAIRSGIHFVVAAGNSNTTACGSSPARVGEALTVGASTINDSRASYSNTGSCVDLFAPGSDIRSASNNNNSAHTLMSGTSMASPLAAGALALVLSDAPATSPASAIQTLINISSRDQLSGIDRNTANLLLNAP